MKEIIWSELNGTINKRGRYLYLQGGYHCVDKGCPEWGSNRDEDTYYIGDVAGSLCLDNADGTVEIPLIFGYTLWFVANYADCQAPFYGEDADPEMTRLLEKTLYLYGGTLARAPYVLCLDLGDLAVRGIRVLPKHKNGTPVFTGYCISDEIEDDFFVSHTVKITDPLPLRITNALADMSRALYSHDPQDYLTVPRYEICENTVGATIRFSGTPLAEIATGVFNRNVEKILGKIDPDGKLHESSYMAPSWRYNGFGTWRPGANQYYNDMYTRNQVGVSVLARLGYVEQAQRVIKYCNKCMMELKDRYTLDQKPIPGHWTAVCDNPFFYSKVLAFAGWYTKYTRERFGDEFQNLGNFEVDGHGFAMICVYNTWLNTGKSKQYVRDNIEMLTEPVRFIQWCLENPELSFSEHGLLYGETEAGLADIAYGAGMKITMYGNVACCEGVRGYAHMAAEAGLDELARKWRELADRLYGAIVDYFVKDGKWDLNNRGFYHDATLSTMSDISGYDASRDFDPKWYALSRDTYQEDRQDYIAPSMVGPRGVGYDHCIFTKNALLLDKVEDYTVLVENLCKMCYSPRLPDPYVVPECACYSPQKRLFRRQGDLGNLVHQSEAVHTLMTVVGLCQSSRGEVKWIPRLPKGWRVEVDDIPVPGREATARLKCGFPEHGEQRAELTVKGKGVEILVRMGPFDKDSTLFCTVNGKDVPFEREIIGLNVWLRVKLEAKEKRYVILAREQ
ncbi:MAG: hypothetical protein IKK58_03280 [Clostridia bacterium]|nr:hypothetical protein [Clostridia bacterium]